MTCHLTRRTGVPDVVERGETFMSNPALSAGPDLDRLTTLKALRVGCIPDGIPWVALWGGDNLILKVWLGGGRGATWMKFIILVIWQRILLREKLLMILAMIGFAVWQSKNQSVWSSSYSQPAKPDGGNGLEPLINPPNKSKSQTRKRTTLEDLLSPSSWSRYITFAMEENNPPSDISTYRTLKNLLLTENSRFPIYKNKLTVKAMTKIESEVLLDTKFFGNKTVTPSDKTQYTVRTGTMLIERLRLGNDENDGFISEAIKEILIDQKQNVQNIEVYDKINRNRINMKLARVVFAQKTVPGFMKVGYKKISIWQGLPTPMICKYCQKYGYTFKQYTHNIKEMLQMWIS